MDKWKFTTGGRFRKGDRFMNGLEMANYASALERTQPPAVTDEQIEQIYMACLAEVQAKIDWGAMSERIRAALQEEK